MADSTPLPEPAPKSFADDLCACIRFWSRIPLPMCGQDFSVPAFGRIVRALPLAGLIIAAPAAAVLFAADAVALPALVAAALALMALAATTGAFHEDGLADCADALGGYTVERRLDIMKDSRVGAFGALALAFSVLLRAGALAALLGLSVETAVAAFLGAAGLSRVAGLLPLTYLAPARADGFGPLAQQAGPALTKAWAGAALCALLPALADVSLARAAAAGALAVGAAWLTIPFARARFGGATGDVAGAAEQISEIVYLLALCAGLAR